MALYTFGAGTVWVKTQDTTPQTFQIGTLQEVSVDINASSKQLFGSKQFPVAVGRGTAKVSGKAKFAALSGKLIGQAYFGVTPSSGMLLVANNEAGTVPATSTYTITTTHAADYEEDLGVVYSATGLPFERVLAGSEAAGKYSVDEATGIYTFASADASAAVLISYTYTSTSGQRIIVPNQLLGVAPVFGMTLENKWNTNKQILTIYNCIASKFSFGTKLEDFMIPEFDFDAFANSAGNIFDWSFSEVS